MQCVVASGSSVRSAVALIPTVLLLMWSPVVVTQATAEERESNRRRGSQFFVRAIGADTNGPILPKTRSAWTQDAQTQTGTTGMSDLGFTEYPFCFGRMDFSFVEGYACYPKLISSAQADERIVNTADLLVDHVYQPDGCVWGRSGREFVQTFTATQAELVSLTLLVASEPGTFRVALLDGGAGGKQIGPSKTFTSGHSMTWGTVRWKAGQAPMTPGRTYGVHIVRHDGAPWSPYLHSTGNAYDGGLLYVDGRPFAQSDMAAWIVEEPATLRRSIIDGADDDGWVYRTARVRFSPRTPNVRLITLTMAPVTDEDLRGGYCDIVLRVLDDAGRPIVGPKRCLAVGPKGGEQTAHFLFADGELRTTPGRRYQLEAATFPHKQKQLPELSELKFHSRDYRASVYGESQPGKQPSIHNLSIVPETDSRLEFRWSEPFPCPTYIESWGPGVNGDKRFDVPKGTTRIVIGKFWAGHQYDLRLTSVGPTGLTWQTPRYRVQMPRSDVKPIVQPEYPAEFVTLASPRLTTAPDYGPLRYESMVPVANHDFEQGLEGWRVTTSNEQASKIEVTGSIKAVGVRRGEKMAGWNHAAGSERKQVFATSNVSRKIPTTPGHVYMVSAWAHTSADGGPRGDTRVRLFAAPAGGDAIDGENASQWYWTDGQWMRFQHQFIATTEQATIGAGLFRWRDLDRASAFVDCFTVFDLGPVTLDAADGPPRILGDRNAALPSLALVAPKIIADDKVEAQAKAPPGHVITGIGARAHYDNITTMWLRVQPLLPDGSLGEAKEIRTGWESDAGLEAKVALPDGYVATGFGAAVAPEWDVKRFRVWARPLLPNGTLGEEKEFRGGVDLVSGVEKEVHAEAGRVLTAVGLNCMFNDINGIRAESAELVQTAAGAER